MFVHFAPSVAITERLTTGTFRPLLKLYNNECSSYSPQFKSPRQHLMNLNSCDFSRVFQLEYDRDREVQRLVDFLTDWVDTQQVYGSAFSSITSSENTSTVWPAELIYSGAPPSDVDYDTFMSGIGITLVSICLVCPQINLI